MFPESHSRLKTVRFALLRTVTLWKYVTTGRFGGCCSHPTGGGVLDQQATQSHPTEINPVLSSAYICREWSIVNHAKGENFTLITRLTEKKALSDIKTSLTSPQKKQRTQFSIRDPVTETPEMSTTAAMTPESNVDWLTERFVTVVEGIDVWKHPVPPKLYLAMFPRVELMIVVSVNTKSTLETKTRESPKDFVAPLTRREVIERRG